MGWMVNRGVGVRGGKMSAVRLIAVVACILLLATVLLSAVLIAAHVGHNHDHHGLAGVCTVCARVAVAERLLKLLVAAAIGAAVVLGGLAAMGFAAWAVGTWAVRATPIGVKVRLNH